MKIAGPILVVTFTGLMFGWVFQQVGLKAIPTIHDEFGYLLEADTFLHGRLTNPSPSEAQYFQTFHELMHPTYMAKFPPGQGLTLAAGGLLGSKILGAYSTIAVACGAIVWAIRAWVPPRWALFGGFLAVGHPLMQVWSHVFWGGGVALLGGALLTGAVLRAARRPTFGRAVIAACGVSILLISRPLEGVIFSTFTAVYLFAAWRKQRQMPSECVRFLVVGTLSLLPVLLFLGYYNWRVTGRITQFPYTLYASQFQKAPLLFGGAINNHPTEVDDRFAFFRDNAEFAEYNQQTSFWGYIDGVKVKAGHIFTFWIRPLPLLFLLFPVIWLVRGRRYRWLVILTIGLPVVLMLITPWLRMQYLAPAGAAYFLLLTVGAQHLSRWRIGIGVSIASLLWTTYIGIAFLCSLSQVEAPPGWNRHHLIDQLGRLPGNHLIIVHYDPGPQQIFEWVFNDADIDSQKVIWARDLGSQTLAVLQSLYPQRYFWKLTVTNDALDFRPLASPLR